MIDEPGPELDLLVAQEIMGFVEDAQEIMGFVEDMDLSMITTASSAISTYRSQITTNPHAYNYYATPSTGYNPNFYQGTIGNSLNYQSLDNSLTNTWSKFPTELTDIKMTPTKRWLARQVDGTYRQYSEIPEYSTKLSEAKKVAATVLLAYGSDLSEIVDPLVICKASLLISKMASHKSNTRAA